VLHEELADVSVIGWLRNVDRKPWSLEIPYEDAGSVKPMFPDLLVVREDSKGFLFDILEPHDPSLKDNAAKAVGLAISLSPFFSLEKVLPFFKQIFMDSYYQKQLSKARHWEGVKGFLK